MAGFETITGTLSSSVGSNASLSVSYPTGRGSADFDQFAVHRLRIGEVWHESQLGFDISFPAGNISINNKAGYQWPAGAAFELVLSSRTLPEVTRAIMTGDDEFTDWVFVRGPESAVCKCVGTAGAAFGGATVQIQMRLSGDPTSELVAVEEFTAPFMRVPDVPVGGAFVRVGVPASGFASATSLTAVISNATGEMGRDRAL